MLKTMLKTFRRGTFARREDGSVAIEAVIMLPMLFWTFLSLFSIFDAFNQYSANQKAAYTLGDMISRSTVAIDDDYLDGAQDLFDYLTRSPQESSIRVSMLRYNEPNKTYSVFWSQSRGWNQPLTNSDVTTWDTLLPVMPDKEYVLVTETWAKYVPPFKTGLEKSTIQNFVFTRPRYASCVLWVTLSANGC